MNYLNTPLERQQLALQPALIYRPVTPGDGTQNGSFLPVRPPADGISICPPPPGYQNFMLNSLPGGFGAIASLIQQLIGMLQQFLGGTQNGTVNGATQPEQFYNDATASSTGDPHLAFNGTESGGQVDSARFDSMVGHANLISSDSFDGGYNVATEVTTPNASGITLNKSATLTTNYGQTQITLDNAGNASILNNGATVVINAGQTLDLGNGQTVTKQNDGSLDIVNTNGQGGTMHTTFRNNGAGGIDVNTSAHNVNLGGDILQNPNPVQVMQPDHILARRHHHHHPHPQPQTYNFPGNRMLA